MNTLSVVNIVASGQIDVELDLSAVAGDLRKFEEVESTEASRNQGNRLLIEFVSTDYLGIVSPTGVYIFTGGNSEDGLYDSKRMLLQLLCELGIIPCEELTEDEIVDEFEIENIVVTADLEQDINLDAIALGLGSENTEYEPEQFPGLVYRSDHSTILIFASGKVVITGLTSEETASSEFDKLRDQLEVSI